MLIAVTTGYTLDSHQYGKHAVRLVHVARHDDGHELADYEVRTRLTGDNGDLARAYVNGDNSAVLTTDAQKNTVYAFARKLGVLPPGEFAIALARHFGQDCPPITRAQVDIRQHLWHRNETVHSFQRAGSEQRRVTVTHASGKSWVVGGISGLALLNTTNAEFRNFLKDEYTTLPETGDRILATTVEARWRYTAESGDWDAWHNRIRAALIAAFGRTYSRSLQETLFAMGVQALEACREAAEIRLALPNQHHLPADLRPFGLDNPGQVFIAADQPYGMIEGSVLRDDAAEPGLAWW